MSLVFSPMQHRCLDALGYVLHTLVGSDSGAQSIDPVVDSVERESSARRARAPSAPIATIAIAESAATHDARDLLLLAAIVRAARLRIDTVPDPHAWLRARGVDSIGSLRGDPAAKRALWPMLRQERRAR